jgi:ATP-dependent exoDNAse (exonuclease V) alpha subunit
MRARLAEQENLELAAQKEAKITTADDLEALCNAHMSAVNDNKEFVEWALEQGSIADDLKKKTYTPDKPLNSINSSVKKAAQSKVKVSSADELLQRLTKSKAIFSQSDILSLVEKINDKQERQSILSQLKSSSELQRLYRVEDGRKTNFFTTQTVRMFEERIKRIAEHVAENSSAGFNIQKEKITELAQNLSQSQQQALSKILDSKKGVVVLQGRAGTGKSQVLGVLNSIVKDQTCVIALTPTQRAAGELREKGFNKVDTIKGFLFKYRNGKAIVGSSPLFIIDEAGMVDSHSYLELLKVAKSNNARMLLTGDDKQLASIELGWMFKIFAQEYGAIEMDEIRRQESAVDKKI